MTINHVLTYYNLQCPPKFIQFVFYFLLFSMDLKLEFTYLSRFAKLCIFDIFYLKMKFTNFVGGQSNYYI